MRRTGAGAVALKPASTDALRASSSARLPKIENGKPMEYRVECLVFMNTPFRNPTSSQQIKVYVLVTFPTYILSSKRTPRRILPSKQTGVEFGERNMSSNQRFAHLFPPLMHKKFARSGKEEQQTNRDPRQKNSEPLPDMQLTQKPSHPQHRTLWLIRCQPLFLLITGSQRNNRANSHL